jgi:molybdopterin converting factor small subunit
MVEVSCLGGLRSKVGAEVLRVEARTVREVLDALVQKGGEALSVLFYDDPRAEPRAPHRDLRILVNGRSIAFLRGLDTPLEPRDKVTVQLSGPRD